MNQNELFHEDIYEALRTDIMALGGFKAVGLVLFPKKADKAGDYLSTCLNTSRPEKLDPEEVLLIKKLAADSGSYAAQFYECEQCNLSRPTPITPEDKKATLQREYIEAVKMIKGIGDKLERLA